MIIAVTGNPGSGKSAILKILEGEGILTHSADTAVEDFYKHNAEKVELIFHTTSREKIMQILATRPSLWQELEEIVHPFVASHRQKFLKAHQGSNTACEVPLLFECGMEGEFNVILLAVAPLDVRKARFNSRWFATLEQRFIPQDRKVHMAHEVIDTNKPMAMLEKEVVSFARKIGSLRP